MTALIVGSTALHHWFPQSRAPKDFDLYTPDLQDVEGNAGGNKPDAFWHPLLFDWFLMTDKMGRTSYATPDELLTIKTSHAYWELRNGSWWKHMQDIMFLRQQGARVLEPLHNWLYKVWEEKYGRKRVDLNMDAADFFDDGVKRVWDHDSIHLTCSYSERPLYERFLKDGHTVLMDMRKVWAADPSVVIDLFREEVYATALERVMIPSDYQASPMGAYRWALCRTITSLTKGKSARFMVDNFETFVTPDVDYLDTHLERRHLLVPHTDGAKAYE